VWHAGFLGSTTHYCVSRYVLNIVYSLYPLIIAITISGNVSVYPGQDAMFVCSLVEPDIHNVVFLWMSQSVSGNMSMNMVLAEDADEEGSTGASGGGDIVHSSTLTISNVNYTDDGIGYYCDSPNCTDANYTQSSLSYLTGRYAS